MRNTLMEVFQPRTEDSPAQHRRYSVCFALMAEHIQRISLRLRCQPTALAHEKSSSQCHRPEKAARRTREGGDQQTSNSAWCQAILPLRHIATTLYFQPEITSPRSFAISYFPSVRSFKPCCHAAFRHPSWATPKNVRMGQSLDPDQPIHLSVCSTALPI